MKSPVVTYVLVNSLGGITSMLDNLIQFRGGKALPQEAIFLNVKENTFSPISSLFGKEIPVKYFSYSKKENWYHVFGNLKKNIGNAPGILVSNDVYDMLMLQAYNINKKVVQIVHDAYNVQLSIMYGGVVDKFICHSYFYYEVLCQLLPERKNDIVYIPYGIPLSGRKRTPAIAGQPLKLMFLGRHCEGKGIFDLFAINNILVSNNIPVQWLIMGRGPETLRLKQQWANQENVVFDSPAEAAGVFENILLNDVFVFPTKFEGFPVALLEAMAAGVVPVATDLPGGLRELVKNNLNGFLCAENNNAAFAEHIAYLHSHREQLQLMSDAAFNEVNRYYNAETQSPLYQELFSELYSSEGKPRHHSIKTKIGSRLDQPWLPNIISKALRGEIFKT